MVLHNEVDKENGKLGNVCLVFVRPPHSIGSRSKEMGFFFCHRAESVDEGGRVTLGFMSEATSMTSVVR